MAPESMRSMLYTPNVYCHTVLRVLHVAREVHCIHIQCTRAHKPHGNFNTDTFAVDAFSYDSLAACLQSDHVLLRQIVQMYIQCLLCSHQQPNRHKQVIVAK